MPSRRSFLEQGVLAALGLSVPAGTRHPDADAASPRDVSNGFDIRRMPDAVVVQTDDGYMTLQAAGPGRWVAAGIRVTTTVMSDAMRIALEAPSVAVKRVHVRWRGALTRGRRILGDAWERGYGDLEWRAIVPDRVLPWYVATSDGGRTDCYGVRTGAAAFCFFQLDSEGMSLWADVRSGGVGVELGARTLGVCDVVQRAGDGHESAFDAVRAFCRQMCSRPLVPSQPVYGTNDWYWAYGHNSAESVRRDAHNVVELSPTGNNRPFAVIDDGWQPERGTPNGAVGIWDRGNERFPDMARLAADVKSIGARPGIWIRPLLAPPGAPDAWRLPRERRVLDPTVPDALHKVSDDIARLRQWGFELIKHDYSTYDLFGRWGFQMGATLSEDGWTFVEGPKRTTAEVIVALYETIRSAAGDALVTGCNTVSHLSAGQFALCRIGDDTSGTEWARTRRMGVNTLAFRAAQHGAFYAADPDCVGVTAHIPWDLNRRWLDLLANSGTVLFASLAPDALGQAERTDLKAAFARAADPQELAEPLDWQETTWPRRWKQAGGERSYEWIGPDGVDAIE